MYAKTKHGNGASVAIVRWIYDELIIKRDLRSKHRKAIIGLDDFFPLPRPLESLGMERMGKTLPRRRSDVQSMVARKPKWKSWPTGQLCRPKDRSRCESLARQTLGSRRSGLAAIIWARRKTSSPRWKSSIARWTAA